MDQSSSGTEILIVGGGFCGMMTCIHLLRQLRSASTIHIVNESYPFGRGIAYSPESLTHLLNVPAAKMSCFPDQPDHFMNWLQKQDAYKNTSREMLAELFIPRKYYGDYLLETWEENLRNPNSLVTVNFIKDQVTDCIPADGKYAVQLASGKTVSADLLVLATGTETPANPSMQGEQAFDSPRYFKNSWDKTVAKNLPEGDVLIIGNGLTMVDTSLELFESHCTGTIYSISPHGFTTLPHRFNGMKYSALLDELKEPYEINELFRLFCKHINIVNQVGLSGEVVVDSVRGISQEIWQSLNLTEKKRFLMHLRHLWGLARHRLPLHIYNYIREMKRKKKLVVIKGKLRAMRDLEKHIEIDFYNSEKHTEETVRVVRVINCTGPLIDITRSVRPLVQNLLKRGLIRPDALHLGMDADKRGALIDANGQVSESVFTLGNNLRGLLWESTAVPELRAQAQRLGELLAGKVG